MNLFFILLNCVYAVNYIPRKAEPISIPFIPWLADAEEFVLLALFMILLIPFLRNQSGKSFEIVRNKTLKISSFIGVIFLVVHFFRILSGH